MTVVGGLLLIAWFWGLMLCNLYHDGVIGQGPVPRTRIHAFHAALAEQWAALPFANPFGAFRRTATASSAALAQSAQPANADAQTV